MRSPDALEKIRLEIENDPAGMGYATKTPAEIAILMNSPVSKEPKVFRVLPIETLDVFATNIDKQKLEDIKDLAVDALLLEEEAFEDKEIEEMTTRGDVLSLGEIEQGDVEQALKK